jgi:hypothetical protein
LTWARRTAWSPTSTAGSPRSSPTPRARRCCPRSSPTRPTVCWSARPRAGSSSASRRAPSTR